VRTIAHGEILPTLKLMLGRSVLRFATGKDPAALLEMIAIACGIGFPFPGWAKKGFWEAWAKALRGELRSWNEVFGRPPTALEARRFNREMANRDKIWNMVAKAKAKGRGIGNALFDEIGSRYQRNGRRQTL
jgi:hypothetical protein